MWVELPGPKCNVLINLSQVVWVEPSPGGTQCQLFINPAVAITVNLSYEELKKRVAPPFPFSGFNPPLLPDG